MYQRLGRFEPIATPPATGRWNFPEPIGSREIVVLPFSEIMTLASHLKADLIESWMNVEPLRDLRDSATPPPQPSDETGRSSQRFAMEVVVDVGGQSRRATAVGQDIYFVTAPIMVEAAKRLMAGDTKLAGGVHALGAMFDARRFLDALSEHAMKVSYATTSKSAGNREIMHVHGR
jgi:hypothetical protein